MTSKLILALALLLGITGTIGSYFYIQNQTEGLSFLRARADIPVGTVLGEEDVEAVSVPARYATFSGIAIASADAAIVLGQTPSMNIKAGDLLLYSHFDPVKSKTEILSQLKSGERAVAIEVGSGGSVANLVEPGDFVDVIATYAIESPSSQYPAGLSGLNNGTQPAVGAGADAGIQELIGALGAAAAAPQKSEGETEAEQGGRYTQTILQNVSVLGVGQRFGTLRTTFDGPGQYAYSTVTVKVTPEQAELLVFAQELGGRLTLTLRNPEDNTWVTLQRLNLTDFQDKVRAEPPPSVPAQESPGPKP